MGKKKANNFLVIILFFAKTNYTNPPSCIYYFNFWKFQFYVFPILNFDLGVPNQNTKCIQTHPFFKSIACILKFHTHTQIWVNWYGDYILNWVPHSRILFKLGWLDLYCTSLVFLFWRSFSETKRFFDKVSFDRNQDSMWMTDECYYESTEHLLKIMCTKYGICENFKKKK